MKEDESSEDRLRNIHTTLVETIGLMYSSEGDDFRSLLAAANYPLRAIRGKDWRGLVFKGDNLRGLDFSNCDLRGCKFKGAQVAGCIFRGSIFDEGAFDEAVGTEDAIFDSNFGDPRARRKFGFSELSDGRMVCWSRDGHLHLLDARGTLLKVLYDRDSILNGVQEISGGRIAAWTNDGTVLIWSSEGELIHQTNAEFGAVAGTLELDTSLFLIWSSTGRMCLWKTGSEVTKLEGHNDAVVGILKLKDGRGYFVEQGQLPSVIF